MKKNESYTELWRKYHHRIFCRERNSITLLKSHQKTITNKFELDFLDDNLLLSGRSTRFGLSFSDAKFSHSFFYKQTDSKAELAIDLVGQPGEAL